MSLALRRSAIIVYMYMLLSIIVDKIPGYTNINGSSKFRKNHSETARPLA